MVTRMRHIVTWCVLFVFENYERGWGWCSESVANPAWNDSKRLLQPTRYTKTNMNLLVTVAYKHEPVLFLTIRLSRLLRFAVWRRVRRWTAQSRGWQRTTEDKPHACGWHSNCIPCHSHAFNCTRGKQTFEWARRACVHCNVHAMHRTDGPPAGNHTGPLDLH